MQINIDRKVAPKKPLIEKTGDMFLFNNKPRFVACLNGVITILSEDGLPINEFADIEAANEYYNLFEDAERVASVTLEVEQ